MQKSKSKSGRPESKRRVVELEEVTNRRGKEVVKKNRQGSKPHGHNKTHEGNGWNA